MHECPNRAAVDPARWPAPLVGLLVLGGGCVKRTPPATAPPPAPAATAARPLRSRRRRLGAVRRVAAQDVDALRADLARIFDDPAFGRMQWAVLVQSLASGETLYSANASKLMMPASNMKIVTLAAAAERLGWDYTYETTLVTAAPVVNGILHGDLVVVGSGDPTIGGRGGSATRVFEDWADRLRAAGITAITGRIVADARAFGQETLGAGWAWDYLGVRLRRRRVGAPVQRERRRRGRSGPACRRASRRSIEVRPIESGLIVDTRVTTVGRRRRRTSRSPARRLEPAGRAGHGAGRREGRRAVGDRGPAGAVFRAHPARGARRAGHSRRRRGGRVRGRLRGPADGADPRAARRTSRRRSPRSRAS